MRRKGIFNHFGIICVFSLLIINAFSLKNKVMACMENVECLEKEYCKKADGDCNSSNPCMAELNGISIDHYGECNACVENII